tara:strand:- start:1054 stop:2859 length:1806 start_codon:yes stop_codon:yes gene_type:complete
MKTIKSLYKISKKIFKVLTSSEKKKFVFLSFVSVFVAVLEVFGVALILPFISIVANPKLIEEDYRLQFLYDYFSFSNLNDFIIFLGIIYLVFLILSQAFKAAITFFQLKFIFMREAAMSKRLLESYLKQPYSWFLNKHSGDLGKSILSEVSEAIHYSIFPLLKLISQSSLTIVLIFLIIVVDPYVALFSTIFLLLLNQFVFGRLKQGISNKGKLKVESNKKRFTSVIEAFGAIKEIKLNGIESLYTERFKSSAKRFASTNAAIQIISVIPKYLLETFTFGFLILFIIFSVVNGMNLNDTLPTLTLYAFALLRLIPSAQQIFASLSKIHFTESGLDVILKQFTNDKDYKLTSNHMRKFKIKEQISLENLSFSYSESNQLAIDEINISIPLSSKIGLVGYTGSGKTTLVDLILGLLKLKSGKILIDNKELNARNMREWQNSIGYVPQQIFLTDQTIAENIAFGLSLKELDMKKVKKASKMAKIDEFITKELSEGYFTKVGERGVRLSGGQRQRIGIARALYNNPRLLILDEATSALDNVTEKEVMNEITNEFNNMTMIIIAHRLNTVRMCDCIYLLNDGKVMNSGSYDELIKSSSEFKRMVEV